jgi:hypothetical protein
MKSKNEPFSTRRRKHELLIKSIFSDGLSGTINDHDKDVVNQWAKVIDMKKSHNEASYWLGKLRQQRA